MRILCLLPLAFMVTSCSTLNESLQLGFGLGGVSGGAATYAGFRAGGRPPTIGSVAFGAGVGATLGLLTSYLVHKRVEEDRGDCQMEQTEMHFGDLPPSPFIVPKPRKGSTR